MTTNVKASVYAAGKKDYITSMHKAAMDKPTENKDSREGARMTAWFMTQPARISRGGQKLRAWPVR